MDIPAYISSGILESYLLGLTTPGESKEVELFATKYPAIRIELNKIEDSLNDYISLYSITPPSFIREKIFSAVDVKYVPPPVIKTETKVAAVSKIQKSESAPGFNWLTVFAFIALLVSAGLNYYQYRELESILLAKEIVTEDLNAMSTKFNNQLAETERLRSELGVITKPGIKVIEMKGQDKSPSSLAMIFWNQNSNEVYLYIQTLPEPPAAMQYQLWAIVDSQFVDLGTFDALYNKSTFQTMKAVQGSAQAFAVTLEKNGGNLTPTIDQMFLMGNL